MRSVIEISLETERSKTRDTMKEEQLLDRFVGTRDEAAFEALMCLHGQLVLGVCTRVLRNHHDAEEAFQATFLILSRKAASIMPRNRVGNWLYGVASVHDQRGPKSLIFPNPRFCRRNGRLPGISGQNYTETCNSVCSVAS